MSAATPRYSPRVPAADDASPKAAASAAARWILREYVRTADPSNAQRLEEIEALNTSIPTQEYPAGHPMGSGAGAYVLEKFFPGTLKQPVDVVSPVCGTRTFARVADAVDDVLGARIWGGMHFRHSGEVGAALGKDVTDWIYERQLLPLEE